MPQTSRERPRTLAVGNDLDIVIDGARVRGVINDSLTLKGYIAAERDDAAPIHSDLSQPATAQGGGTGDYLATISGAALTARLLPTYLHRQVWIIGESVPAGAYRDAFAVTVVEDQSG